MAAIDPQHLNSLFILLHRSLLQYVGECWPWTSEDAKQAETLAAIRKCVQVQKDNESLIADPLNESGWIIDFGGYPTQYTDLHYVSLSYLLKQLVTSQGKIVDAFDAAAKAYPDSPVLQKIADSERQTLYTVQSQGAPRPTMVTSS